jgi:hypothetical protein
VQIILSFLENPNQKISTEGRTRTGTGVTTHRILSPVRLPIPPPRQIIALPFLYRTEIIFYLASTNLPAGRQVPPPRQILISNFCYGQLLTIRHLTSDHRLKGFFITAQNAVQI